MREGAGANVTENPASDFLADSQACSSSTNMVVMILIGHLIRFMQSMIIDDHNGLILLIIIIRR